MKVRVLGCSGAIAQGCRTTAFLIEGRVLIDAGTGVGDLTLEEMRQIDHVLLTHSHLDHVAALPLMLDAVSSLRSTPVQVHALPATIAALQAHVFNNVIWPDFSRIPSAAAPFLIFKELETAQMLRLAGLDIEVLPAIHTVPAVGYAVRGRQRLVGLQRRHRAQPRLLATHQPVARGHAGHRNRIQQPRKRPGAAQPAPGTPHPGARTGATQPRQAVPHLYHPYQAVRNAIDCGASSPLRRHHAPGQW